MLAKTFGSALHGVDATIITVEVSEGQGQHFFIVGLPDGAVKESEQRVESAIKQVGYFFGCIQSAGTVSAILAMRQKKMSIREYGLSIFCGSFLHKFFFNQFIIGIIFVQNIFFKKRKLEFTGNKPPANIFKQTFMKYFIGKQCSMYWKQSVGLR